MGPVADEEPAGVDAEDLVRFVRTVAHGLRNPLAIATGMLDLLEQLAGAQLDEQSRELLVRSSAAVHRTADMVLHAQRTVSARHRPLQPLPVEVGDVVARAVAQLDPAEVSVRVDGELPTLTADQDMVEWVVQELLDNARRHAREEGTTTVTVDARRDGDRWLLAVTDDGEGIPAEQHEDAFAEGERLGRAGGGLGLGLTMVRAVLARHGGDAWLEAAPAGGLRAVTAWPTTRPGGAAAPQ